MAAACRIEDVVCRFSGEEFGIIVPNTPADRAVIMCERLRKKIGELKLSHRGMPVAVTCSFGIADMAKCGEQHILQCAEKALSDSKTQGRDRTEIATGPTVIESAMRVA